ncbi:hypothetical protein BK022_03935 [Methylorubrum extorquens]|uniref:Uncharacterized protein n=1 Tax=Methylorubrum extorquens TaxID=408 RepID=A0A1S1P983_METEX|nr:hypothetical protein BK022_03935 [Methylorubrum extorquens]
MARRVSSDVDDLRTDLDPFDDGLKLRLPELYLTARQVLAHQPTKARDQFGREFRRRPLSDMDALQRRASVDSIRFQHGQLRREDFVGIRQPILTKQ